MYDGGEVAVDLSECLRVGDLERRLSDCGKLEDDLIP